MRSDVNVRVALAGVLVALLVALPLGAVLGQQLIVGGHALDSNLRMGSGGYNRPSAKTSYMSTQRYAPGATKPVYVVGQTGEMVYKPNNAFFPKTRYTSTGYNATYQKPGWHSQFRYQGQYLRSRRRQAPAGYWG
jgi:hypothetical protein